MGRHYVNFDPKEYNKQRRANVEGRQCECKRPAVKYLHGWVCERCLKLEAIDWHSEFKEKNRVLAGNRAWEDRKEHRETST